MVRKILLYFFLIGGMLLMLWVLLKQGAKQEIDKLENIERITEQAINNLPENSIGFFQNVSHHFSENIHHWSAILILQLALIIGLARLFSYLARKMGQPSVIGEIIAGIILGPSLLGYLYPEVSSFIFPISSLQNLSTLSTLGLLLFMFIIGMEVDIKILSNRAHDAVLISHSAIVIPFFLGTTMAFFLYKSYAPDAITFVPFALFMGIAMSITAFPVLARIIQERGLTKTYLGSMAITCAAVDDVTAWCILALVIALVKSGELSGAASTIVLATAYISFMIIVIRPFMNRIGGIFDTKENLNKSVIALIFLVLLFSSWISEIIGIHALFGAFLAGAIMPQKFQFKQVVTEKIEDVAMVLLLPLFFVTTGLRTEIGLLNTPEHWFICLGIILIATLGKMGGVTVIARFLGISWKNSLSMGALMNARGLMELVVLNIAYDLGILSKELFTMMVLMALTTTFMTGPLLDLFERIFKNDTIPEDAVNQKSNYNILISFGPSKMGRILISLAQFFIDRQEEQSITVLHITPQSDVSPQDALLYERNSFAPIKQKADELNIDIVTKYLVSQNVEREIQKTVKEINCDLLLVGGAKPIFNEKVLGGKIKKIIENVSCDVAVLSDKNFHKLENLLIIIDPEKENRLLDMGLMMANHAKSMVTIINANLKNSHPAYYTDTIVKFKNNHPSPVTSLENRKLDESFLNSFDLIMVSELYWNNTIEEEETEIRNNYSYLILHTK